MIFPLEQLTKYTGNVYEITVAASRRAFQMTKIEDEEVERNGGKAVSVAARQVFNGDVTFQCLPNT